VSVSLRNTSIFYRSGTGAEQKPQRPFGAKRPPSFYKGPETKLYSAFGGVTKSPQNGPKNSRGKKQQKGSKVAPRGLPKSTGAPPPGGTDGSQALIQNITRRLGQSTNFGRGGASEGACFSPRSGPKMAWKTPRPRGGQKSPKRGPKK